MGTRNQMKNILSHKYKSNGMKSLGVDPWRDLDIFNAGDEVAKVFN